MGSPCSPWEHREGVTKSGYKQVVPQDHKRANHHSVKRPVKGLLIFGFGPVTKLSSFVKMISHGSIRSISVDDLQTTPSGLTHLHIWPISLFTASRWTIALDCHDYPTVVNPDWTLLTWDREAEWWLIMVNQMLSHDCLTIHWLLWCWSYYWWLIGCWLNMINQLSIH